MGIMDWLRRNWPDLLIGVALVAVIAGIIATLISGGTFFPVGGGSRTADTQTQTGPSVAGSNQGAQPSSAQTNAQQGAQDPAVVQGVPVDAATPAAAAAQDPSNVPAVALPDTPAAQPTDAAGAPPAGQGQAGAIAVLPPDGQPSASSLTTTAPSAAQTTPPASSQPSSVTPATDVAASSSPEAPYRVSVGAYGNVDNARRQLETFRAAGYPVFLGTQGNLNIVLVGPYDTEAEARSVAQRISQSTMGVTDPTVYLLETDDATAGPSAAAASPAAPAAQPVATSVPAGAPAATPAAGPQAAGQSSTPVSGDRYLQVGAYGSRDSSLPQRERLEGMGFVVSERLESDLVKLLIGPFDASGLANAQGRLQAAGIESFPR